MCVSIAVEICSLCARAFLGAVWSHVSHIPLCPFTHPPPPPFLPPLFPPPPPPLPPPPPPYRDRSGGSTDPSGAESAHRKKSHSPFPVAIDHFPHEKKARPLVGPGRRTTRRCASTPHRQRPSQRPEGSCAGGGGFLGASVSWRCCGGCGCGFGGAVGAPVGGGALGGAFSGGGTEEEEGGARGAPPPAAAASAAALCCCCSPPPPPPPPPPPAPSAHPAATPVAISLTPRSTRAIASLAVLCASSKALCSSPSQANPANVSASLNRGACPDAPNSFFCAP
jgi:hypothetical protein